MAYDAHPSNALKKEHYKDLKAAPHKAEDVVMSLAVAAGAANASEGLGANNLDRFQLQIQEHHQQLLTLLESQTASKPQTASPMLDLQKPTLF